MLVIDEGNSMTNATIFRSIIVRGWVKNFILSLLFHPIYITILQRINVSVHWYVQSRTKALVNSLFLGVKCPFLEGVTQGKSPATALSCWLQITTD